MRDLILLLNVKATGFLKNTLEGSWEAVLKNLASLLIFGGFAIGVFLLSRSATHYLLSNARIGLFLFHRFLSMLLYVFFITVNLGNMIVCYATLYRSEEVRFLMALPIDHAKIFVIKFIDNFFYSSSTLFIMALAMLLGYGSAFGFSWEYYFFTMFGVLLPFMLLAGIIAVVVLMALVNVGARLGIRWLLAAVVVTYLIAIFLFFQATNPVAMVQEVMKHYPNVNEYFGYLDPPFVRYLPNHWVSEFLYWVVAGDMTRAFASLAILIGTVMAVAIIAFLVAKRYYYTTWLVANDAQWSTHDRTTRTPLFDLGSKGLFDLETNVFLKRDTLLFFREPSQWLHLALMLLLMGAFLVSTSSIEMKLTQPIMQTVSFLSVFLFSGFMIASVTLRFVFPAISLEGDPFWSVRSAPVSLRRLYGQKFIGAFISVFVVAEVLVIFSTYVLRGDVHLTTVSGICTAFLALTLTAINLGAGAYFANYHEKNPIRLASSQGASLTFLMCMLYLAAVIGLLAFPLNTYFELLIFHGIKSTSWSILPLVMIVVLSAVATGLATAVGWKSFRRDY